MEVRLKKCSKCKEEVSPEEFYRNRTKADGLSSECKKCSRETVASWCARNRESSRQHKRDWRARNLESARDRSRKWGAENRERRRESLRKRRARNPDLFRERGRRWRAKRPDLQKEYRRAWRETNPERHLASIERRRSRFEAAGPVDQAKLEARLDVLGRRCFYCPGPFEALDHSIPLARGGTNMISNLRPVCSPCNSSKGSKKPSEWTDRIYEWRKKSS